MTPTQERRAALYAQGLSLAAIARSEGCSVSAVWESLIRTGVERRPVGFGPTTWTKERNPTTLGVPQCHPYTHDPDWRWDIDACIARLARQIAEDERRGGSAFG